MNLQIGCRVFKIFWLGIGLSRLQGFVRDSAASKNEDLASIVFQNSSNNSNNKTKNGNSSDYSGIAEVWAGSHCLGICCPRSLNDEVPPQSGC